MMTFVKCEKGGCKQLSKYNQCGRCQECGCHVNQKARDEHEKHILHIEYVQLDKMARDGYIAHATRGFVVEGQKGRWLSVPEAEDLLMRTRDTGLLRHRIAVVESVRHGEPYWVAELATGNKISKETKIGTLLDRFSRCVRANGIDSLGLGNVDTIGQLSQHLIAREWSTQGEVVPKDVMDEERFEHILDRLCYLTDVVPPKWLRTGLSNPYAPKNSMGLDFNFPTPIPMPRRAAAGALLRSGRPR